ncbi:MAG: hypothetical protein ACRELT_09185, partial [Longimicrobiales bacterium]
NDSRLELADWLRDNARPGDRLGFYGASAKLPALEAGIQTVKGPYETSSDTPGDVTWPEFIVLLPQQPFENEHEWTLPREHYYRLRDGIWNYEPILFVQTGSLWGRRPVSWVNPPVRLYARRDVIPRLKNSSSLELD